MKPVKAKNTEMMIEAAARVRQHESEQNDGKIPKGSFGSRADAAAQRRRAVQKGKSVR
jgi:hypothetical protein